MEKKNQKLPSAENWRKIVSRGNIPLLLLYELAVSIKNIHKVIGCKAKITKYIRVGSTYLYEPEVQKMVNQLRLILKQNPKRALDWIRDFHDKIQDLSGWLAETNKTIAQKKLSKSALKKLYLEYEKKMQIIWRWCYLPFLFDEAIESELNDLLAEIKIEADKVPEIIKILSVSPKITLRGQEEIKSLKLALQIRKKGANACANQIKKHWTKWKWQQSWIYNQHYLSLEEYRKELLNKKNPAKLLSGMQKEKAAKLRKRKECLARLKNKRLNILADILSEYSVWHFIKMEAITKAIYLAKPLLDGLAKELGLSYLQLVELSPDEVKNEKFSLGQINRRSAGNGVIILNGKIKILSSAEFTKIKQQLERKPAGVNILKGAAVFGGKVCGKAAIVSGVDFAKIKIKQGDILVAVMTTTNMIPLLKKAAAIVTDEGGLLCHAAIIARELRIPCVIGTKIATKILKDGDLVEVDTERGIVKILNP